MAKSVEKRSKEIEMLLVALVAAPPPEAPAECDTWTPPGNLKTVKRHAIYIIQT